MTIKPITPADPVCFGVCCSEHSTCARYHRVDGAGDEVTRIDSCESDGERPLFVALGQAQAEPAVVL